MNQKTKTILTITTIILVLAGIGTGVGIWASRVRNKRNADEIETLLEIAHKEGNLSAEGYNKFRKLIYLDDYKLPASLQAAFNKIQPLLVKAGNGIRSGFAVSSMQFFNDITNIINTESTQVKNEYHQVQSLLQEAFKLNAASNSVQEKLNSANQKSVDYWKVVIEAVRAPLMESNTETKRLLQKWLTKKPSHETTTFDKKLMNQSFDTLKLFSESFKALSGGKDFFAVPKNP